MKRAVGNALSREVTATFGTFRGTVRVEHLACNDWASVTFYGAVHRLRLILEGDGAVGAAADFLELMPGLELPLPGGQFLADIDLVVEERCDGGGYACLEVELLTIEE